MKNNCLRFFSMSVGTNCPSRVKKTQCCFLKFYWKNDIYFIFVANSFPYMTAEDFTRTTFLVLKNQKPERRYILSGLNHNFNFKKTHQNRFYCPPMGIPVNSNFQKIQAARLTDFLNLTGFLRLFGFFLLGFAGLSLRASSFSLFLLLPLPFRLLLETR